MQRSRGWVPALPSVAPAPLLYHLSQSHLFHAAQELGREYAVTPYMVVILCVFRRASRWQQVPARQTQGTCCARKCAIHKWDITKVIIPNGKTQELHMIEQRHQGGEIQLPEMSAG